MTADRFGPGSSGEFTAVSSVRPTSSDPEFATEPAADAPSGASSRTTARGRSAGSSAIQWRPQFPPQHGAWAFIAVPVLVGMAVAGWSAVGWLYLLALLVAYPVGYYGGRALTARIRRGSWTRLARRELGRAVPWAVLLGVLGLPLVVLRPWLVLVGLGLAALWLLGLWVADRFGERSMANDLVLVAQALVAVPSTVALVAGLGAVSGGLAAATWTATALVAGYLVGSVIHVKSLLREAGDLRWRRLDIGWHVLMVVLAALVDPCWLVGFGPALIRSVVGRPGARPGLIGGIEAIVAVLVVVAAMLAG